MNWIHVHLALNHIPVLGPAFIAVFYLASVIAKHRGAQRFCLWMLVGLAVVTVPIKFTGEFAMDAAGKLGGVEPADMSVHEDAADQATTAAFLLGVAAVLALVFSRGERNVPKWAHALVFLLIAATLLMMARSANTGGEIRHPEIRKATR